MRRRNNKHRMTYPAPQALAEEAETPERKEDCSRGTIWTNEEVKWLVANYPRFPPEFCAKKLRRSEVAVRIKVHRLRRGRKEYRVENTQNSGNVSRLTVGTHV